MPGKWRTRGETPVLSRGFRGTSRGISPGLGEKRKGLGGEMRDSRGVREGLGGETGGRIERNYGEWREWEEIEEKYGG